MESKLNVEFKVKINAVKTIILYLLIFYFVWSFKELWLVKYIYLFGGNISALLEALIKITVWIVPTWIFVKYYLNTNPINYLKMNVNVKKGLFWGIILSLFFGLFFAFEVYILNKQAFNFSLPLDSYLNDFLVAGITEEILFRGLILQEMNKRLAFWKANGITALLFLFIHYPIWINYGKLFNLWSHLYIILLGLLFGFVYKKTGSIWSVVLLHSFHNFFLIII